MKVGRHDTRTQGQNLNIRPHQLGPQRIRKPLLKAFRRMINTLPRERWHLERSGTRNVQDRPLIPFFHAALVQSSIRSEKIAVHIRRGHGHDVFDFKVGKRVGGTDGETRIVDEYVDGTGFLYGFFHAICDGLVRGNIDGAGEDFGIASVLVLDFFRQLFQLAFGAREKYQVRAFSCEAMRNSGTDANGCACDQYILIFERHI